MRRNIGVFSIGGLRTSRLTDSSHFSNLETRLVYHKIVRNRRLRSRYNSMVLAFFRGHPFDRIVYDMSVESVSIENSVRYSIIGLPEIWQGVNYWEITARLIDKMRESGTLEKM